MDATGERALTDQKIAAAEARSEKNFAVLNGKLDLVLDKVAGMAADVSTLKQDNKNTRSTVVVTGVSSTFAVVAILIAVLAYGASSWYNGTVVADHRAMSFTGTKEATGTTGTTK